MDLLTLVDKLESMATASGKFPGTRKIMIEQDKLLELVDQMRLGVPRDIVEAEELMARREAIINQSLLDARRIKSSAEEEGRNKVHDSEIVSQAHKKAEQMIVEAQEQADGIVMDAQKKAHRLMQDAQTFADQRFEEANQYAHETLYHLEMHLSTVLNSVRRGLDSLEDSATKAA